MNLSWNPDVTVRTRGIMEKCTFCTQRIRTAKDIAKDEGRKVHETELKTACQQTCPTNAITFGDINDANTQVSKHRNDPRAFRVLEVLNTVPSISYLSKVRNKDGSSHGHSAKEGEHHG
jgi:molybdopterin-containing oxidoreductase family iron-sulfur binding subunit